LALSKITLIDISREYIQSGARLLLAFNSLLYAYLARTVHFVLEQFSREIQTWGNWRALGFGEPEGKEDEMKSSEEFFERGLSLPRVSNIPGKLFIFL